MAALCGNCLQDLNRSKAKVRTLYETKIKLWNKYCVSPLNRVENGCNYEQAVEELDEEIYILVHNYKQMMLWHKQIRR